MKSSNFNNYFFIGIAGTGMSAIAQYLSGMGKNVSGSDRQFTSGRKIIIQEQFEKMGIICKPQDGSGINELTEVVIVSTAIEDSNIEYQKAMELGIPCMKRSELLATISKEKKTIAVGGTSGKSTTTAMIFHILKQNGYDPSLITGAGLVALQKMGLPGNAWVGKGEWLVIEADESDGSIVNYIPEIGLLLNVDRDHKEYDELLQLFTVFKNHTRGRFIVNHDHAMINSLSQDSNFDFGTDSEAGFKGTDFRQEGFSIFFSINGTPFKIPVIGKHNMENAMAATSVASSVGIEIRNSAKALESYSGIYRRTQLVGQNNGVQIIDDFAHNPSEVAAAMKACQQASQKLIAWFQPHGYGPLKFMHIELAEKVVEVLRESDVFIMSDVYYAGGTVSKDIESEVVINNILKADKAAILIKDRSQLASKLKSMVSPGTIILLMGARDPSLSDFAVEVFNSIF